ncbi:MAG: hypothetical protein IPP46_02200 [Bacteroidetes bacterium]|nr:hypothetical protein [Bacteroidota bacterium]
MFDANSYTHIPEFRKMSFKGTEATICNSQGDFLMSSNGVWIANANNDTMLNGSGLNPNGITSSWAFGLPAVYNNVFLNFPNDTTQFALFHHTFIQLGANYYVTELYSSSIDMQLDSGLGGVTYKNNIIIQDTLAGGIAACKHANGRDWWVVMIKENSDLVYKILFTPQGIASITTQNLVIDPAIFVDPQITFSQDGTQFACQKTDGGVVKNIL